MIISHKKKLKMWTQIVFLHIIYTPSLLFSWLTDCRHSYLLMEKIYQVLVIGAGISGIAAAKHLAQNGVEHIILESRQRIGGRILSGDFAGGKVQLGASFVHHPDEGNRVAQLITLWGCKNTQADYASIQYILQGGLQPKPEEVAQADLIVENFMENLKENPKIMEGEDTSLEEAAMELLEDKQKSPQVKSLVTWCLDIVGNIDGAELSEISAREFENAEDGNDFLPVDGYSSIIEKIVEEHKPTIILGCRVKAIDYLSHPIKIYAGQEVYYAERVISSLPLGVLKAGIVKFLPALPENHQKALQKIGSGVANKIFARFSKPFWDQSKKWINFVTKERRNRYPVAFTMGEQGKQFLCFFVSGDRSKELSEFTDFAIQFDLTEFLQKFSKREEVIIQEILVTRWHMDPHSLGSYSYSPVGTTVEDLNTMRRPIQGKLWFVGEYCHPEMNGCAHAAYETGVWAAEEMIETKKKKTKIEE